MNDAPITLTQSIVQPSLQLMSILDIILAIFLPPVVVFLKKGAGKDLVINLVLWILLFGVGGIIHAFWLLSKK